MGGKSSKTSCPSGQQCRAPCPACTTGSCSVAGQTCQPVPCALTWTSVPAGTVTTPTNAFLSDSTSSQGICRINHPNGGTLYGRIYQKSDDHSFACSVGYGGAELPAEPFEYLQTINPSGSACQGFAPPRDPRSMIRR